MGEGENRWGGKGQKKGEIGFRKRNKKVTETGPFLSIHSVSEKKY